MKTSGIEEFQNIRKEIMLRVISQSCQILLDKKEKINPANVVAHVKEIFEEENLDMKYFVGEQSIGRNPEYRTVVDKYETIQKNAKPKRKQTTVSKYDEFDLRDKYDLLSQDYIELLDKYKWLENQNISLKKSNESLISKTQKRDLYNDNPLQEKSIQKNIVEKIKMLVEAGATVIIKSENKIIIKSYLNHQDKRYEFSLNDWNSLE